VLVEGVADRWPHQCGDAAVQPHRQATARCIVISQTDLDSGFLQTTCGFLQEADRVDVVHRPTLTSR
jgi:hypothetical protein